MLELKHVTDTLYETDDGHIRAVYVDGMWQGWWGGEVKLSSYNIRDVANGLGVGLHLKTYGS